MVTPAAFFMQSVADVIQSPLKFIQSPFRICLNVIELLCDGFSVTWHLLHLNTNNSEEREEGAFRDWCPRHWEQSVRGSRLFPSAAVF